MLKQSQQDAVEKLKMIGFSEYAAKAYVAIVALKRATAPELAKLSDVPQAKIYSTLSDLYDLGFIGKDEESRPTEFFAYKPLEKFDEWLGQFRKLAEYLEMTYDTDTTTSRYGFYSIGNFTDKLQASNYYYIFDQSNSLYSKVFIGKIGNYYRIGGNTDSIIAINKKGMTFLLDKGDRVQFVFIEDPLFIRTIDTLMAMVPVNRSITAEMEDQAAGEPIIFVDTVMSSSGFYNGQNGKIWISPSRLFIKFPGSNVYARPLQSVGEFSINSDGALNIVFLRKDGVSETNEVYTYSDPEIIKNLYDFIYKHIK